MNVKLWEVDYSKVLHIAGIAIIYISVSLSLAFICHRLYLHDCPVTDVFTSVLAITVFIVTLFGLIFWTSFRVFVYLLVPKLFNVNGRTLLIAYISFLTLTGPVWNTKRNIGVMSATLVCSFEEIRNASEDLVELLKEPIRFIKKLIDTMEERAKKIFAKLADDLKHIEMLAENMIKYFQMATEFLKRLTKLCEGSPPVEYCMKAVADTIRKCEEENGSEICKPLGALYPMCAGLISLQIFCIEIDYSFLDLHFVEYLEKGFRALLKELETFVDVEVGVDGDFEVITNKTKTYTLIRDQVTQDFEIRTAALYHYFDISKILSIIVSLLLFVSVYRFRHHYLTDVKYQNRYLLRSLDEINDLRVSRGDPSVYPLNFEEERRFIIIFSWRVTYWELVQSLENIGKVILPCFYVFCLCFGDYALYYLLLNITKAGRDTTVDVQVLNVEVEGQGFAADYMQSMVDTFEPMINGFEMDFGVCAPQPFRPDEGRLITLFFLCLFSLAQSILYPFAARAMHLVMEKYYVQETRKRMVWLYNDIIRRRKTMQMIVYERLTGNYGSGAADPIPIMAWLRSEWGDYWICRCCLGGVGDDGEKFCVNCAKSLAGAKEAVGFFKCPTYGCEGIYCRDCIRQLQWVCILCKKNVKVRVNYGQLQLEKGVDLGQF